MSKNIRSGFQAVFSTLLFAMLVFWSNNSRAQFYSGSQMTFGKNRIQYTEDRYWSFYRFNDFDTYYYKGGQSLAIYASAYADKQLKVIGRKLDYSQEGKIRFIVFKDLSDLKETNIGLITDENYNIGGVTHVIDNKVFLFFNGDHKDFELQIRRGIVQVFLNEMMYGGRVSSKIKNSILLSFPTWYTDGLISYLSEGWNTDVDNITREGFRSGKYEKFDRLNRVQQRYASHSIWKFIEERYGADVISDVLYMAKISRNIESGFLFVVGLTYEALMYEWYEFFSKRYENENISTSLPENFVLKRNKSKRKYSKARISSDGRYIAYTTNEIGKVKVYIKDLQEGSKRCVLSYGYKLDEKVDYSYPLLAWSPKGNTLAIIYEKKRFNYLLRYDYESKRETKKLLNRFDKVRDFSFNKRGNKLAISAIVNGQSDIYIFNIGGNSYKRITQDAYDDNYPRFVNNDKALVWSSNRHTDTLEFVKQMVSKIDEDTIRGASTNDLFFYNLTESSKVLRRITNTPLANEIYPMPLGYNQFSWLSDENGIYNRYVGVFDSTISYIDTATHYRYFTNYFAVSNYGTSIIEQDFNIYAQKYTEIVEVDGKTRILLRDIPLFQDFESLKLPFTAYMEEQIKKYSLAIRRKQELQQREKNEAAGDTTLNFRSLTQGIVKREKKRFRVVNYGENENPKDKEVDIDNYVFGESGNKSDSAITRENATNKKRERSPYYSRSYDVEYSISQIVTQIDFSYMNYSYQAFTNPQSPIYINQGFNAFVKLGVMDLLEDYRLVGGVKLSPNLQNNEYFLSFSDYKNRLDKEYTFHRNVTDEYRSDRLITHYIHEAFVKFGLPFDNIRGLRTTLALRNDNAVTKATSSTTLVKPDVMRNTSILKMEYVCDKSRNGGLNIIYGSRYKFFAEYYQPMEYFNKNLFVFGFDYRKYIQIHKTFVWANRIAGSTSLGTERLIYYMGGVDNWMNAKFNDRIQIDEEQNFAYQTLATNMRGFHQNIRNGNNFMVINSELKLPVFQYFSKVPIKSPFLNNLMFVGFFDIGTAWTGNNPFDDNNSLFKSNIYRKPVQVTVINQQDPIVAGYGFGVRSQVFGYYFKADWAWGIQNGYVNEKSVFYFSLGLDF